MARLAAAALRVFVLSVICVALLLATTADARAEERAEPPPAKHARSAPVPVPVPVTVGLYVNQIHELNLKENFFVVDAFVWFRWRGDDVKPNETFTFIDGRIESKSETGMKKLPDGGTYASYRVVVKVTKYWDVRQYPLDQHLLSLVVEEDREELRDVVYVADAEGSALGPAVRMPGFTIGYQGIRAGEGRYHTSFGDPTLPSDKESAYGRVTASISLTREGSTYFAKLFFSLWIAAAIAFLSFFVKPTNVDPRFGLGVGAIFAAIASEYTVSSGLPEIGAATLADRLHVVAYAAIFVTLAQSTYSLWLCEHGAEDRSRRFDRLFSALLPLGYALSNVIVIATR